MSDKPQQSVDPLAAQHPFLDSVAQTFPAAILAWRQGRIVFWNETCTSLFGYARDDALSRPPGELLACQSAFSKESADTPSTLYTDVVACRHANGQSVMTRWKCVPSLTDDRQTSPLHIAIIEDISAQLEQEYEHKLTLQSFNELTEHLSDYIYVHDLQGNFTRINENIATALGYTREEFLTLNIRDIVAPSFLDAVHEKIMEKVSGKKTSSHYEILVIRKDGTEFWIEVSTRLVYVDTRPVAVQGIARDIDDRKKYEFAVARSEEKFRNLFETIDDIYYRLDNDGMIELVSPSAYTHLGYRTQELQQMHIESMYAMPEQRTHVLSTLLEHGHINNYEVDLVHKNNSIVPFSVSARVIYDENGRTKGIEGIARNISQRKEHEKILINNEQRFRRIFESIQDVYFRAENTIVKFVSPSCKGLLGYTPEEMIGHHTYEFYNDPAERQKMLDIFQQQGYLTDYEIEYLHKNGKPIACSLNLNMVRDENGEVVAVEGTLRDITLRKETEQALRSSEQRFRRIFESFQDLYYEADMDGNVTILSPSVETLYGYKPEELIGKPATTVYADPRQREELVKALAQRGYVNDYEIMLVNKNGQLKPTSCSTRIVFDDDGKPMAVQGVLRDITQRKKSEAALRESEARFRSIFKSIPDAFLEIDRNDMIINASPSVEQFNYSPERLVGSNISVLFRHRDDWHRLSHWVKRHNEAQRYESLLQLRSGQSIPVSITAYKISKENLIEHDNLILIIRDISDSKHYEQELELARDQALEASRAKSSFLANMSHELRTPLNAIIGYSEMLAEDAEHEGREEVANDLTKIHASGLHLLSVISDILDLSKIEAGKVELNMESFDITELVNDIMMTIAPLVRKNNNTLVHQCALTCKSMVADPVRLKQTLFNLLSNACKFTMAGTIYLEILSPPERQDRVFFRVRDTGIGIKDEQMEKLFSEFTQADSTTTRKYGGTGLGLVISQRFCQLMGGEILAESRYGQGSTFTVDLPIDGLAGGNAATSDQTVRY